MVRYALETLLKTDLRYIAYPLPHIHRADPLPHLKLKHTSKQTQELSQNISTMCILIFVLNMTDCHKNKNVLRKPIVLLVKMYVYTTVARQFSAAVSAHGRFSARTF
jgi:hypothetical protein